MPILEIDLIRHVKVDGKSALYGSTDVSPLVAENDRLLAKLILQQKTDKSYQSIICSPLQRCHKVAKEFASACHLPLEVCDDLQEMNFGIFDGVSFDNIPLMSPDTDGARLRKPNKKWGNQDLQWPLLERFFQNPAKAHLPEAERLACFYNRVTLAWQCLIEQQFTIASEQNSDGGISKDKQAINRRVLIIAHGGIIRMIIAHILQLDWQKSSWHQQLKIENASLTRINLSRPYDDKKIFQQVTTIAMPFL
jgi:alpha-ribazole phosphatase/probable phosphoglycerate mutase